MDLMDMRDVMLGLSSAGVRLDAEDQVVVGMMKQYFDEMYEVEKDDVAAEESRKARDSIAMMAYLQESCDRKLVVHQKYWCNDSSFYKPISMSNHPDHDWSRIRSIKVLRTGDAAAPMFLFLYVYPGPGTDDTYLHGYVVRGIDGVPKIDHKLY